MKLSILIVILSFTFFLGIISAEDCGFDDELCPGHLCCSNGGKCGSSRYYCGNSCFSQCWDQEREDHRCGPDFGDAPCGENRCCSRSGWCGSGYDFCSDGDCQYRCFYSLSSTLTQSETKENSISGILSASLFDEMFKHRKDCPSQGFYSYDAFINATTSFPSFGRVGDLATRKRELAAFLAQTSQATSGGLIDSVDPHAWGYCHIDTTIATSANNMNNYCTSTNSPCVSGKKYNSRGPIQLTHNYNYGLAGAALGLDLLNNPDLVATDPVVSFKTAIWFWMTRHDNKTSCHNVLINADSKPRDALSYCLSDGYLTNGAHGNLNRLGSNIVTTTVGYYKRYCDMLDVSYGHWLPSKVTRIQMSVL